MNGAYSVLMRDKNCSSIERRVDVGDIPNTVQVLVVGRGTKTGSDVMRSRCQAKCNFIIGRR